MDPTICCPFRIRGLRLVHCFRDPSVCTTVSLAQIVIERLPLRLSNVCNCGKLFLLLLLLSKPFLALRIANPTAFVQRNGTWRRVKISEPLRSGNQMRKFDMRKNRSFRRWGFYIRNTLSDAFGEEHDFLRESCFYPILALINLSDSDPKIGRGKVLACDNASLSIVGPLF